MIFHHTIMYTSGDLKTEPNNALEMSSSLGKQCTVHFHSPGDLKIEPNNSLEISNFFRKAMHWPFSFILVSAVWMVRILEKTYGGK